MALSEDPLQDPDGSIAASSPGPGQGPSIPDTLITLSDAQRIAYHIFEPTVELP